MRLLFILFLLAFYSCKEVKSSENPDGVPNNTHVDMNIKRLDGSTISEDELSGKIQKLIDAADVTGIAISIMNQNEVVFNEAFGYANYESKSPLRTDQIFYGASFSKAVFGYLVAQLVVEGRFDLDVPLQDYLDKPLPDYKFEKEWRSYNNLKGDLRYEKITGRMCLSHTTGFPNWRWLTREFDFDREGKIRFLLDPGQRYSYSGEGINLLQFVLQKITGKGLEEMARTRIFDPLEMNMTSYVWQQRFDDNYCHGHTTEQEVIKKDIEDEANAAGSMETTIEDYSKLMTKLFSLSKEDSEVSSILFNENVRITSKAQFGIEAWEDTDVNDEINLSYGLGWGLLTSPYGKGAFKEGHGEGFQHYSIIFPEKGIGVILMSNSDNAESVFKELLEVTIGDVYTPWKWERYTPYNL